MIAHAYRTGKHIMWFKYFVWRWPAVKMKMRNDLLSISMAEHNLSDPDVRELSYRCVRIHWGLDLPSNAQYFSDATTQVFLRNYARDSFWKTGENLNIFRYNLAPLVTRKLYNSEVRNAKKYKNTVMMSIWNAANTKIFAFEKLNMICNRNWESNWFSEDTWHKYVNQAAVKLGKGSF